MANQLYVNGLAGFTGATINWLTDTIRVCLINLSRDGYVVDLAKHKYLSDIPVRSIVATSDPLAGKTLVANVADADDVSMAQVTGDMVGALVIYKDTGDSGTSPLIAYIDTATGLATELNGGTLTIAWDSVLKILNVTTLTGMGTPTVSLGSVVITLLPESIYQLAHQGIWMFDVDYGQRVVNGIAQIYSDNVTHFGDTVMDLDDIISQMKTYPQSRWLADVGTEFSSYRGVHIPDIQAIRIEFLKFTDGLNKKDYYGNPSGDPTSML